MMELDDTEDEPETSQADAPEWEPRRQTRSTGFEELLSGLPNTPAPRKRPVEETLGSSGDSTASIIPPLKINPGAQAKHRKTVGSGSGTTAGVTASGPSGEPGTAEPTATEPAITAPEVAAPEIVIPDSLALCSEPAATKTVASTDAPPPPEPATDETVLPAPRSSTAATSTTPEVIVTGTAFNPLADHVLTKHIGEAGSSVPAKLEFEFPSLENLTVKELHSGYLNRLDSHRNYELKLVNLMKRKYEEALSAAESRVTGLKEDVTSNQTARSVAKEKLCSAVEKWAQVQTELSTYKKSESTLIKRAEDVEGRLKTVSDELTGLKKHISQMSEAIFGKRSRQLSSDSALKLKAVCTLTEQLYCGVICTIKTMLGKKSIPDSMKRVLDRLSTLPQQVDEFRKSAARKGGNSYLKLVSGLCSRTYS